MIKREKYIDRIRPFIGNELIKVITGVRRSGKSYMLSLLQDELRLQGVKESHIFSYNFESITNRQLTDDISLYNEISKRISKINGKAYLFFDEIQEVKDWEKCINSFRVDFDCDIYITGSNAKLLSGELATYLGGRYVEFTVYPLSFEEYLEGRGKASDVSDIRDEFLRFIIYGGMPFLINMGDEKEPAMQYLRDIYNSVVLKDIVGRNNIRDVDLLERIIQYIFANTGQTFSARSISNYFKNEGRKVAPETILNYLKACHNAYLIYKFSREDVVGKKILSVNEKYYVVDHGIREAVYGNNERDINQVLENIICIELLRRGYRLTIGRADEKEIDFIARKGDGIIYFQVTYLLASEETLQREFGAFDDIKDNYPKYVLSMDELNMSRNGIIHMNIRDFLLTDDWG